MKRRARPVILLLALAFASPALGQGKVKEDVRTIEGLEAIRLLYRTGKLKDAEQFVYVEVWKDIRQPEAIHILGQTLMRLQRRDEAATWYRILMRLAEDYPSAETDKFKPHAEKFLKFGEREHEKAAAEYLEQAGGKFPGKEKISDLWMTQVAADLHPLKELQLWAIVDGHPQVPPGDAMWIHANKGVMHRSGMKLVDEVEGRKGVLFAVPHARVKEAEKDAPADVNGKAKDAPLRPTRITFNYPGKGKTLRLGVMMWGSKFQLEVTAGGKKILDKFIDAASWLDLSAELPEGLKKDDKITLELILPRATEHIHGAWIDYIDVFE